MRKLLILTTIIITVFMASCGDNSTAIGTNSKKGVATVGDKNLGEMKPIIDGTPESVDPIGDAVSEGVQKIEDATNSAIARIESATGAQSKAAESQEVLSAELIKKEIPLNIEARRGSGSMTITKFETNPDTHEVTFRYITNGDSSTCPLSTGTILQGKSGKKYYSDTFGESGQNGILRFKNITDYSDLTHVTLTYAFEGYDPVTVTFDIPMQ